MSQYTHIFLHKGREYLEISCTGRGSALSEIFDDYAPWGKVHHMTTNELRDAYHQYCKELDDWKKYIERKESLKTLVATFNNTPDEKMEVIHDCDESIENVTETIEALTTALARVSMLIDIEGDPTNGVSVFVGCECGSDVTDADRDDYVEAPAAPNVNLFDGDLQ